MFFNFLKLAVMMNTQMHCQCLEIKVNFMEMNSKKNKLRFKIWSLIKS